MNTAPSASQSAESFSTKQNPATTINNSGPLDPSWNRVYTLSEDGPATSTEPDAEWECETEEELVTLDLSGFGSRLVRGGVECALISVDSPSPHLRIGDHIFRGHWTEPIGTDIHLNVEKDPSRPPHQQHVLDISPEVKSKLEGIAQHDLKANEGSSREDQASFVIDHSVLADLSNCAQISASVLKSHDIDPQQLTLYALTRGAKLYFTPKPKFERSPELEKSLAAIRLAQEQAEYERISTISQPYNKKRSLFNLTEPPRPYHNADSARLTIPTLSVQKLTPEQEAEEWAEANKQISAVLNIVVSMGAVATAAWWAAGSASVIWKTLVCLLLAIVVGVAETVMYARYWRVSVEQTATRKAKMTGFDAGKAPIPLSFGQSRASEK
ncbi:hypothetical protein A4X09_0g6118 [Tilletia walkeri]|uniref:Transcription factor TFIIIC triple barrel domain-containing protein n=1 Tax=Tilletia walkeri TaxID=117179 RepID=A0A8X7N4G8_9BASI|nr:hypothetical protein A4X09_0g6118 [Tilletia walkeri]